jgi:hypothetical protein
MNDQQAYAGQGDRQSGTSEWNRMNAAIRSVVNQLATMTPVRVVAVRAGSVDVEPLVAQLDGAGNAVPHGTLHNLPVYRAQSGGIGIIMDPVVGDRGVALFAHSDISSVKANRAPSPPGSRRRFDWSDGVFLPGLLNDEPVSYVRLSGSGVEIEAPTVTTSASLAAGGGATGSFSTTDGKVVTVVGGIIVGIA